MDYNGLQLPESLVSQSGSSRKPYFSIIGTKRAGDSFYSPYLDLATENFVGLLEDLKLIPVFCCQRIQGSRKPVFSGLNPTSLKMLP